MSEFGYLSDGQWHLPHNATVGIQPEIRDMGRILQRLHFQTITRTLEHIYPQQFVFQCSAQALITALRLSQINFAPNKSNEYESDIQDRVLRERK